MKIFKTAITLTLCFVMAVCIGALLSLTSLNHDTQMILSGVQGMVWGCFGFVYVLRTWAF